MNKIKYFGRPYWHRKYVALLEKTHSEKLKWEQVKELYCSVTGKWLDWNNPKDINEKLMWLNRYDTNPLKTKCADKYLVREYVKEKGLEKILIPLLGVWNSEEEIDFDSLPNKFVLKCNHGCGMNIICKDKSLLDVEKVKSQLATWMRLDYSSVLFETHYKDITRKIICEQFIDEYADDAIVDYKFHCFEGNVHSCLVCYNRNEGLCLDGYSKDWERLDVIKDEFHRNQRWIERPKCLDEMMKAASELSKGFKYCRVDLYEIDGDVGFGELTFTPAANMMTYYKQEFLDELGNQIMLF